MSLFFTAKATAAVSCGDTIYTNVTLTADLSCTSSSVYHALTIAADDVTIDLNGHSISGGYWMWGIYVTGGVDNVTIKNGALREFVIAINAFDNDNLQISDITFFKTTNGISLNSGRNSRVEHNSFILGHETAIGLFNTSPDKVSKNNLINDNEIYKARAGVEICGSDQNTITNNFIWKSLSTGIFLDRSADNAVSDNTILESDIHAIYIDNSSYNIVTGNTLKTGGQAGIVIHANGLGTRCVGSVLAESAYNYISGNYSIDFTYGAFLTSSKKGAVYKNAIVGNKIYDDVTGIYFDEYTFDNNAKGNGYQGTITSIADYGTGNSY